MYEYAEYGLPIDDAERAVGHWVWLRQFTGPVLVMVTQALGDRMEILPQDAEVTRIVPTSRLAWSYREAVAA